MYLNIIRTWIRNVVWGLELATDHIPITKNQYLSIIIALTCSLQGTPWHSTSWWQRWMQLERQWSESSVCDLKTNMKHNNLGRTPAIWDSMMPSWICTFSIWLPTRSGFVIGDSIPGCCWWWLLGNHRRLGARFGNVFRERIDGHAVVGTSRVDLKFTRLWNNTCKSRHNL